MPMISQMKFSLFDAGLKTTDDELKSSAPFTSREVNLCKLQFAIGKGKITVVFTGKNKVMKKKFYAKFLHVF